MVPAITSENKLELTPIKEIHRGIAPETYSHYRVGCDPHSGNIVFPFFNISGDTLLFQKIRFPDNSPEKYNGINVVSKGFQQSALFGSWLWPNGGRYLTITEGEFDALSAYELMGSKWASVSLKNGVNSVLTDDDRKFIEKWENVTLCLDNDKPGQDAAKKYALMFPKKVKIVTLSKHKDANEYLQAKDFTFVQEWWKAREYTPEGLVSGKDTWDILNKEDKKRGVKWPWNGIQNKLFDIQTSKLYLVTAGSGVGKSEVIKEIGLHIAESDKDSKLGVMFLEESVQETVKIFTGMKLGMNLRIPDNVPSFEDKKRAWSDLFDNDRWLFWDHFGSNDIDSVCSQVRFVAVNFGARYIFLDHVSIIVSAQEHGDERKALDEIMTKLRMLVQETDICLFLVSHLRRSDKTAHEEGGVTSLAQLRGSAAIGQLADVVIGLERNGQADNEVERNITTLRLLKNRITGETGPCAYLQWSRDTGRLSELDGINGVLEKIEESKGLNTKSVAGGKADKDV